MKRIKTKEALRNPTFINSWIIEPPSLCDNLIEYFESNIRGQIQGSSGYGINKNFKDSIDISINPKDILLPGNEIFNEYFEELFQCHKDYISQW